MVALYRRAEASDAGIFAGGLVEVVPRSPEVTIIGPTRISIDEKQTSVIRPYHILTDDLRPPFFDPISNAPLAVAARVPGLGGVTPPRPGIVWSGDGTPLRPGAEVTGFSFNMEGARPGKVLTRRVAVIVVDADGLTASAELFAQIHVTPSDGDGDFPPVCKTKPWLPQCKEPMARLL